MEPVLQHPISWSVVMRRLILALSVLALMSGVAVARQAQGIVASYTPSTRVIKLQNGRSYTVPRHVAVPRLNPGDKVSIMFNDEGDKIRTVLGGSRASRR